MDAYISKLKACQPLLEREVKVLCEKAVEILVEESNVQHIDSPVTICEHVPLVHEMFHWCAVSLCGRCGGLRE